MQFIDTHCHIHEDSYAFDADETLARARAAGVQKLIVVGTSTEDSADTVAFAATRENVWASIGLHPHDAKLGQEAFDGLAALVSSPKVVAIGECGLDYFYNHSSKEDQIRALEFQMQLAKDHDLPMIFHIRDAFDDFWPIYDRFGPFRGVVHSFTATEAELAQVLARGLYVGLNGIMTFTKDPAQLAAAKAVPLANLVLETDAPFLTPVPVRGTVNEPKNVVLAAEFLSKLRGESLSQIAEATTQNAQKLFGI
jgi:TatD DNase family protein